MTSPADGARHAPIVDPALSEERGDPADRDPNRTEVDQRDPLGGDDAARAEGDRSTAERDEEQRYGQDRNAATPYNAQDNPDVISLDEQHDPDAPRGERHDATGTAAGGAGQQTHRADVPVDRSTDSSAADRDRDALASDRDRLAADRDDLAESGALGADGRRDDESAHGVDPDADGRIGSAGDMDVERGAGSVDDGDRVHDLRSGTRDAGHEGRTDR